MPRTPIADVPAIGQRLTTPAQFARLPIGAEIVESYMYHAGQARGLANSWRKVGDNEWQLARRGGAAHGRPVRDDDFGAGWRVVYLPGPDDEEPAYDPIANARACGCAACMHGANLHAECMCADCRADRGDPELRYCEFCSGMFEVPRNHHWGNFCDHDCYDNYYSEDDDDYGDSGDAPFVHDYNYTPCLNFLRANEGDQDEKLFLGVELEVPTDYSGELAQSIHDTVGRSEDLLYCKYDGSINGVEIVSHPMTHKFIREQFPFKMFKPKSAQTQLLRTAEPPKGYGLHVHVSREGFKSEAHILRWLLLIYRNQEAVAALARRESAEWANFADNEACIQKARNVTQRRQDRSRWDEDLRRYVYDEGEIIESPGYMGERYVAVNAQNEHTFEIRVFRSTWTEQEFRAAVDFAHATVVYTRGLSPDSILHGSGLSFDKFRVWLLDRQDEYAALSAELDRVLEDIDPALLPQTVTLTESEEALACAS